MGTKKMNDPGPAKDEPTATELLESFSFRLTQARIATGYKTRKSLADDIGVDQNTYSPWERGRSYPNIKDLHTIRRLLRISADWLLYGDENNLSVETYRKLKDAEPATSEIWAKRKSQKSTKT